MSSDSDQSPSRPENLQHATDIPETISGGSPSAPAGPSRPEEFQKATDIFENLYRGMNFLDSFFYLAVSFLYFPYF